MTIVQGKALSPEEELHESVSRIDIPQIYADYMLTEHDRPAKRLLRLVSTKARIRDHRTLQQLEFLDTLFHQLKQEPIESQAYIMLGGFEYAQLTWGEFPNSGPLFDLAMKQDDLLQIISENAEDITLKNLFDNPSMIQKQALDSFQTYAQTHPDLHSRMPVNTSG